MHGEGPVTSSKQEGMGHHEVSGMWIQYQGSPRTSTDQEQEVNLGKEVRCHGTRW